jgi:Kef-type K+ transport system membrane component KefB
MDFLKTMTGKVVSGLVGLAVITCAISWYRMDPQTKQDILSGTGKIFSWFGVVLIVPWLSFALIGRVAKFQSNAAGAMLVLAMTLIEMCLLGWLFNWSIGGRTAWTFLLLGGLVSAIYNLLTCDWIAEKVE